MKGIKTGKLFVLLLVERSRMARSKEVHSTQIVKQITINQYKSNKLGVEIQRKVIWTRDIYTHFKLMNLT